MEIDVLKFWNEKTRHIDGLNDQLKCLQSIYMCGSPQPEYLFSLSYSLTGRGAIVEIGTCSGISLIAIALGQKLKKGVPVTSIDIKKHDDIDKNIAAARVEDYTKCIIDDANHFALQWQEPIEMLWIDGDHSAKGVSKDILSWENYLIEGGLMAFHDYRLGTGAFIAINKYILSRPWIWRVVSDREYGSIFVAQKLSGDCKRWVDPSMPWNKMKKRMKHKIRALVRRESK
jgi:hypothetical protein